MDFKLYLPWSAVIAVLFLSFTSLSAQNLIKPPPSSWNLGTGSFALKPYGKVEENVRVKDQDHMGQTVTVWHIAPNAPSTDHSRRGGFDAGPFSIHPEKSYRLSVWLRKKGSHEAHYYFSLSGTQLLRQDGATHSSPFLWSGSVPYADRWYWFVGYIRASGEAITIHSGHLYDGETGEPLSVTVPDYQWQTTAAQQVRVHVHGAAGLQLADPRLEPLNDQAPTFKTLFQLSENPRLQFTYDKAGNQVKVFFCPVSHCAATPSSERTAAAAAPKEEDRLNPKRLPSGVVFYPNPTAGLLVIAVQGEATTELTHAIRVYDTAGTLLQTVPIASARRVELDLSLFPAGVYHVHIHLNNGKSQTQKIIKL